MYKQKKRGSVLRYAFPPAQFAGALLIALNLGRFPSSLMIWPLAEGSRKWLMLWPFVLLALAWLAERKKEKLEGMDLLSFLALAVPGLFLVNAAALAHVYVCWYQSGSPDLSAAGWQVLTAVMATGCVLFLYGLKLTALPFGSIWGIRTKASLASPESWQQLHRRARPWLMAAGLLILLVGTLML